MLSRRIAAALLALTCHACDRSGDFESECKLPCAMPDGGVRPADAFNCACAGPHTFPSWEGCD